MDLVKGSSYRSVFISHYPPKDLVKDRYNTTVLGSMIHLALEKCLGFLIDLVKVSLS